MPTLGQIWEKYSTIAARKFESGEPIVTDSLDQRRASFANDLRKISSLRSEALVRAFATVHREDYLGRGPWRVIEGSPLSGYRTTADADPGHLYANILVAIDESRQLNNGQPSGLAAWLDALDIAAGDRMLHVGCGVGYYTAIIAEVVGAAGAVTAIELDPELAKRSTANLAGYDWVSVHCADGSSFDPGPQDVIFVNAGATDPQPIWLNSLADAGRMLFPMTVAIDERGMGGGHMLRLEYHKGNFDAKFVSPVGIYPCFGGRDSTGDAALREAFGRGGQDAVRSLRTDIHDVHPSCWLHRPDYCLSTLAAGARAPAVH